MIDEGNIKTAFGLGLRRFRLEREISQEKFAEMADLHQTYISDIERGRRNVSLVNIVRLADALNITPSELLEPLQSAIER